MERYLDAKLFGSFVVAVLFFLCSRRMSLALALVQAGFLNIDCGAVNSYVDLVTGFTWVPDAAYINSTGNVIQTPLVLPPSLQDFTELKTLRYFDDLGPKKFCYTLPVTANSTYLLRATFFYGDYNNENQPPSFQLAIDATILDNVTTACVTSVDALCYFEYHYVSQSNVTYLCLIRTSDSPPFISGISLKPAAALSTGYADQYGKYLQQGIIMKTLTRVNYGGTQVIRAPDDFYDRLWFPEGPFLTTPYYLGPTTSAYQFLSTNSTFGSLLDQDTDQPSAVMQTAVTSNSTLASLMLPPGSTRINTALYMSVYYGEVINSVSPTPRNFTIQVPGFNAATTSLDGTFLQDAGWDFYQSIASVGPNFTMTMTPLATSLAGPILNCMEVFARSDPRASKTVDRDARAIEDIKMKLTLAEWTGDPCLPTPHSWIACSSPDLTTTQPQIIAVNLSGYQLQGTIPASLANLSGLTSLILDNNNLSGPLPEWLTTLKQLKLLSIQNNNFSGPIPDALLSTNSPIRFTCSPGNPLLIGCPAPTSQPTCGNCHGKSTVAPIVGGTIGAVVGLILILGIAIVAYRRKVPNPSVHENEGKSIKLLGIFSTGGAKAYSYAEVKAATNRFNRELGKGGFGPVYYGKLPDRQEVAVKVADGSSKQGEKEFFNEVEVLSRVHHKNLVALVGYCQEQKSIVIYEYMENGSLFDHLHGTSVSAGKLDWRMRLHIALSAARGLEYLHTGCSPSFIHRDVKSSNILLTPKFDAKVADFGLAKLLGEAEHTRVMTDVMGTAGYLDPEYYTTQYLSCKSDVYSFGIVLLELITGRPPIDQVAITAGTNAHIVHWVRENIQNDDIDSILDVAVKASNPNMEAIWKVVNVAMRSVEPYGVHRPTMTKVVQDLQGALIIEGISMPPT